MKTKVFFILTWILFMCAPARTQHIDLVFTAEDSVTAEPVLIDSVMIFNITSDCDTVIYGPDPTLSLFPVGIDQNELIETAPIKLTAPFPNPARGAARFEVVLNQGGPIEVCMYSLSGRILCRNHFVLNEGCNRFLAESGENTVLFISVSNGSYSRTVKIVNTGSGCNENKITLQGCGQIVNKSTINSGDFIYSLGDLLSYTIVQEGYYTESGNDSPLHDTTYSFMMNPVIDGWYVVGTATACHEVNENAMMHITRNEVTQQIDPDVLELYIPVMAGGEGFNIVEVSDGDIHTYGPAQDFTTVVNGRIDEPQIPFQRGSYEESNDPFTVPEDGMYHIAIFTVTMKAAVVPVHWGMIGTATVNAWNFSVPMEESGFDLSEMSWENDSMILLNGEWKYRYSDGWKVFLDTTYELGNGMIGVGVNANFGGSVDSLVPGGENIPNYVPGLYSSVMEYVLGEGYQASLTFIDSLPITNWVGVVCDAVGTGISPDNALAIPDPSSWNWGYQLIADNGGVPNNIGNLYTWTWESIILEAYEGFKLRTLNGLPSPINNIYFDAGYLELNVAASAPQIISGGAPYYNLIATEKASYTIILHIDAENNDVREIIITMD